MVRSAPIAVCAVAAASLLAACSGDPILASGRYGPVAPGRPGAAPAQPATAPLPLLPVTAHPAPADIGKRVASAALDDRSLGTIRGGLSTGSDMVVNFSFQEATYVNHNLTQSVIIPTVTMAPGSNTGPMVGSFSPGAVAPVGNSTHIQVSSPGAAIQSIVNNGMTSIVSNLSHGAITNVIGNTASNQLIQQVITANIGITGLSQAVQQSVASTVLNRVVGATQFR